jgi:hypothetical protein
MKLLPALLWLFALSLAYAAPPSVSKVEPADWRGVRLENLLGATPAVEVRQGGLENELPGRSAAIYR